MPSIPPERPTSHSTDLTGMVSPIDPSTPFVEAVGYTGEGGRFGTLARMHLRYLLIGLRQITIALRNRRPQGFVSTPEDCDCNPYNEYME